MPIRFDCEDEPNEFMEMPCQCDCGKWFDLHDGYTNHETNKVVCKECADKLNEESEKELILPALVLNQPYAIYVKDGKKTIETRMRRFHHWKGGDLVICMGKSNDHPLAGKAICVVQMGMWRGMDDEDAEGACIENVPGRYAYDLCNLRQLSYNFSTTDYAVQKNYQGIFTVRIPDFVKII